MVRRRRGRFVALGGAGLLAALIAPAAVLGAAPAAKVQVGDFNRSPEIEFNAFYPGHVTVAQGSKVTFTAFGFHTITFPKKGAKLPSFVVAGPAMNPAQTNAAGAPFWWSGVTPQLAPNPAVPGPTGGTVVTGARTVSSGFLPDKKPNFTVSFPKTGTFQVRCLVHPNMKGTVTVVPKGSPKVSTATQIAAQVKAQKKADRAAVNAAVVKTRSAPADVVTISPGNNQGQAFAFYPAKRAAAVGQPVTFRMGGRNEVHTVSFGPAAYLDNASKVTFQGSGLELNALGAYPSNPPAAGPPVVTPTANGNGYVNSGILRDPGNPVPAPTSFTVTFGQPGVYDYICLVHPEMRGQITVS